MKSEPHVTALDLDLLVLGQAAPEQLARIETHSAACPFCAARRAEHGKDVHHFRTSVFARTAGNLRPRRRPGLALRWMLGLALPLAACVLLLARSHTTNEHSGAVLEPPLAQGTVGIKGPSALRVFARRNGDVTRLNDGDRLAAGDALRFVLSPTGLPYVLIASIDGAGQVNVYYPFHGEASIRVDPQGAVSVPGSIVLDKAPGPERIFVIHSTRPVLAQTVREALAEVGAGGARMIRDVRRLPIKDTVQSTLFFEKEELR